MLLQDWEHDRPDDLAPLKLRIQLFLDKKDAGSAFGLLSQLRDKAPEDKDLAGWEKEASKSLLDALRG